MKNRNERIIELENELKKLKEEEEKIAKMSPSERLAIFIHDSICRQNHADSCGWHYEFRDGEHNWSGNSHLRYLTVAASLLDIMSEENAKEAVLILRNAY